MKTILLILALLVPFAATATDIDDMRTVVETLRGKATDNAALIRIADAFASHWSLNFSQYVADPENPTNLEKARFFLSVMKQHVRTIVVADAEKAARVSVEGTITAAGEAAAGDID